MPLVKRSGAASGTPGASLPCSPMLSRRGQRRTRLSARRSPSASPRAPGLGALRHRARSEIALGLHAGDWRRRSCEARRAQRTIGGFLGARRHRLRRDPAAGRSTLVFARLVALPAGAGRGTSAGLRFGRRSWPVFCSITS